MDVLVIAGLTGQVIGVGLMVYGRRYLSIITVVCACGFFLAYCILSDSVLQAGIFGGVILANLALMFWGGPKGRQRTREQLGDESQQLRDGLVRRMRQRRITRRGISPEPSQ
jgi:hypothetical protein